MIASDGPAPDVLTVTLATVMSVIEGGMVNPDASLADDLDADSLDLLCIRMELEERLAIVITDEAFSTVRTVADLAVLTDHLMVGRAAE